MELDGLAVSPGSATDKQCDVGKLLNLSEADMGTMMLPVKAPRAVPDTRSPSPTLRPITHTVRNTVLLVLVTRPQTPPASCVLRLSPHFLLSVERAASKAR